MKTAKEIVLAINHSIGNLLSSFHFELIKGGGHSEGDFHKINFYNKPISIELSASLHPHDYPYYLSIIFKHDEKFNPGFISLQELINCLGINVQKEILFPINNQSQIELSTSLLIELLSAILHSKSYVQCIK